MSRIQVTKFVCKLCLERNGIESRAVTEHLCASDRTGKQFTAFVCVRCLDSERETRVTCRSFIRVAVIARGVLASAQVPRLL
jgi:hypothetical protein